MRRVNRTLDDAEAEIKYLYVSKKVLKKKKARIKEIDALLNAYGVASPQIRSSEEAKYQRGTKIYTDMPLMELFTEQDQLIEECRAREAVCALIQEKLDALGLTKQEERLLFFRYQRDYTYEDIAVRTFHSWQAVQRHIGRILQAYSEL